LVERAQALEQAGLDHGDGLMFAHGFRFEFGQSDAGGVDQAVEGFAFGVAA